MSSETVSLVVKLEPKLDYARVCRGSRDDSESTLVRLSAGRKYTIRLSECRRVCQVENLGTKLEVHLFSESRVLDKCNVRIPVVGTAHWIPRGIAQGKLWHFFKCRCVEPFRRAALI